MCFPPTSGIPSGISTEILLIPSIALFINPITALIGTLHNPANASKQPPNIPLTPSQAFFQLPVNTPLIKSNIPLNTFIIPLIYCFILPATLCITFATVLNVVPITLPTTFITVFTMVPIALNTGLNLFTIFLTILKTLVNTVLNVDAIF